MCVVCAKFQRVDTDLDFVGSTVTSQSLCSWKIDLVTCRSGSWQIPQKFPRYRFVPRHTRGIECQALARKPRLRIELKYCTRGLHIVDTRQEHRRHAEGSQAALRHCRGPQLWPRTSIPHPPTPGQHTKMPGWTQILTTVMIQKVTPRTPKPRISRMKGHLSKRTAFVRDVVKEVSGYGATFLANDEDPKLMR
jgi:hypothetical protein